MIYDLHIMPGMSDHDIVSVDFCIKLKILSKFLKKFIRQIRIWYIKIWFLYWMIHSSSIMKLVLLNSCGQSLETLPYIYSMNQYIWCKISIKCNGLSWTTSTIQRQIRKCNKWYQWYKAFCSDEVHHKFLILKHFIQKQIRLHINYILKTLLLLPLNLSIISLQQNVKRFLDLN